jgi:phage terminase large subunit GpA-like protein
MPRKDVAPSWLPTFLLPCPHCGHRMTITGVAPARIDAGMESNDLEDVTHGCAQCGTTLTRTIRPLMDAQQILQRA